MKEIIDSNNFNHYLSILLMSSVALGILNSMLHMSTELVFDLFIIGILNRYFISNKKVTIKMIFTLKLFSCVQELIRQAILISYYKQNVKGSNHFYFDNISFMIKINYIIFPIQIFVDFLILIYLGYYYKQKYNFKNLFLIEYLDPIKDNTSIEIANTEGNDKRETDFK